jgi:zinc/manganese transport system substrate-binding protein
LADGFAGIPAERRKLVTNHHVLGYLAQRFGFTVIGAVVPSGTTLAAPSPSDLQSLAGAIESAGVPAIFVDSSQPERLARVLAEDAGLQVQIVPLYSESLSPPGTPGSTYLDMMRANTDAIVSGLR